RSPNKGVQKQEDKRSNDDKHEIPNKRVESCYSNGNKNKKVHKKDTSNYRKITDDPEDLIRDVQSLFDVKCGCESRIDIRKDECKANNNDTPVYTSS
ncbi:27567_t:CDS:1, partial [Racocetra persica]